MKAVWLLSHGEEQSLEFIAEGGRKDGREGDGILDRL